MTDRTLLMSAFSIQSSKPTTALGQLPALPLASGSKAALLRAPIPADIPRTATIISAVIRVRSPLALSGATTLSVARNLAPLVSTVTWNSAPAYSGTAADTEAHTDAPAGQDWTFDVTDEYQAFISGTQLNYGFRLFSSNATSQVWRGATAQWNQPVLELSYAVPGSPPTDLMPDGGAVATSKPTLTFTVPDGCVSVQVQLNDVASSTGIDFDSGEVASVAGLLNLADTAYAGLASGASTYWRARYKDADLGWSTYSKWAQFSYTPQPALTITTPDSTPSDPTPTVSWTFAGETAWRVRILDELRRVLADSGYRSGNVTEWTPLKAFTEDGQAGTIEVQARDGVDRVAVPGYPTWAKATLAVTVDLDATVAPMATLTASQADASPLVTLTGTRSEIPDEVVIFRNGQRVDRLPGVQVFSGTAFTWVDYTAPPNHQATYRVAPVTSGAVAKGGPTAVITPQVIGWWVLDANAETGAPDRAVAWGDDAGSWNRADVAVVHQAISGKYVRRRLGRPLVSGSLNGTFVDALGFDADDQVDTLNAWAEYDAGYVFRLVAGDLNIPVVIGDVVTFPTPLSGTARVSGGQLAFWQVED